MAKRSAQILQIHPVDPEPRLIRQAAEQLMAGDVIVYPTDSTYALACHIGCLLYTSPSPRDRG